MVTNILQSIVQPDDWARLRTPRSPTWDSYVKPFAPVCLPPWNSARIHIHSIYSRVNILTFTSTLRTYVLMIIEYQQTSGMLCPPSLQTPLRCPCPTTHNTLIINENCTPGHVCNKKKKVCTPSSVYRFWCLLLITLAVTWKPSLHLGKIRSAYGSGWHLAGPCRQQTLLLRRTI